MYSGEINRARCSGASASERLALQAQRARVLPEQGRVVLFDGLDDALPGSPPGAEGRHECAVLAAHHEHLGVRLVEMVVELGQQGAFFAQRVPPPTGSPSGRCPRCRIRKQCPTKIIACSMGIPSPLSLLYSAWKAQESTAPPSMCSASSSVQGAGTVSATLSFGLYQRITGPPFPRTGVRPSPKPRGAMLATRLRRLGSLRYERSSENNPPTHSGD